MYLVLQLVWKALPSIILAINLSHTLTYYYDGSGGWSEEFLFCEYAAVVVDLLQYSAILAFEQTDSLRSFCMWF